MGSNWQGRTPWGQPLRGQSQGNRAVPSSGPGGQVPGGIATSPPMSNLHTTTRSSSGHLVSGRPISPWPRGVPPSWRPPYSLLYRTQRWHRSRVRQMARRRRLRRRSQSASHVGTAAAVTIGVFLLIVVLVSSATAAGSAYAYYTSESQAVANMAMNQGFQTTRIYDREGRLLFQLYGEGRRTFVSYDHISPWMIKATVDVEDKTFWTNSGVDVQGIVRAAINDLSGQSGLQGASTITQQLVRNAGLVGFDQTIQRKLEEAVLAIEVTNQYPKYKILEMYLNTVYYGDSNYGVEAAAESYFNMRPQYNPKLHRVVWPAEELDLAHASLLAGLPRSPSDYAPDYNPQAALARQQEVLTAMENVGDITPQQAAAATKETEHFIKYIRPYQSTKLAPWFVDYIIHDVLEPSIGAQLLNEGGLNIYTTLDLPLEQKVEQIIHNVLTNGYYDQFGNHFPPLGEGGLASYYNAHNAAAVLMEPRTGEILAMVGSADYNADTPQVQGQYNIAIHATRQAGSAFKPIVYATALQMGWFPSLVMQNVYPTCFPAPVSQPGPCGNWYAPSNFDGAASPPLPLRQMLDDSMNIPAVQAIEFTGIKNVLINARRMGITSLGLDPSKYGPSLVLGTAPVSLLQLTNAYSVFDNQGRLVPPVSILQINDAFGHVLYRYQPAAGAQVLSPQIAYLMTNILSDDLARQREFYLHSSLTLPSASYTPADNFVYNPASYRPAAAKTGTTDDNKDILQVGYTPYLVCGTWVGNSDDEAMAHNIIGVAGAGPIWQQIMEYASNYYHLPPSNFPIPPGVVQGVVSASTGLAPYAGQRATYTDWFLQGDLPAHP
jgi:membrane peptidoglycan carboxypeptidase